MELHYGTPQEAGMSPSRVEHVKALARGWVDEGVHPALVVLAARKGVIFLHEAFGKLRPGPDSPPLKKDSIFPIMSATKPITAACVLLLVEEGKVGLMRPVRDYFPEITGEGTEEVLVHHLLTHLSGWRESDVVRTLMSHAGRGAELPPPAPGQHRDLANVLFLTRSVPLAHRPGEAFQYCNLNYQLLGDLVRRASGVPIERFAQERLFAPLGMVDSSYVLPSEHRDRKVRRAPGMPGVAYPPGIDTERFEGTPSGPAGVHTTARDYAVFAQMLLGGGTYAGTRILSRASVEAMRRNHIPPGVPQLWEFMAPGRDFEYESRAPGGYGYGLFIFQDGVYPCVNGGLASPSSVSHGGAFGTNWWADPERELVGVYMSVTARIRPDSFEDRRDDLCAAALTAAVAE